MKKHTLLIAAILGAVLIGTSLYADDYVDDAYYWEETEIVTPQPTTPPSVDTTRIAPQGNRRATQSIPRQAERVRIVSANDTVVKAIIRR